MWESICRDFELLGEGNTDLVLAERSRYEEELRQRVGVGGGRRGRMIKPSPEIEEELQRMELESKRQKLKRLEERYQERPQSKITNEVEDWSSRRSDAKFDEDLGLSPRRSHRSSGDGRLARWEQIVVKSDSTHGRDEVLVLQESTEDDAEPGISVDVDSDSDDDSEAWAQEKARELLRQWTYVRAKAG